MITNAQHLVSRTVDPIESAVVSITRIHAGTADNIIPEAVELGGTVRTFDAEVRADVREGLERVFRGVTEAHGATYTFDYEEGYAAVINDEAAAATVLAAARAELGDDAIMDTEPIMGGEDFSAYLAEGAGRVLLGRRRERGRRPASPPALHDRRGRVPVRHRRLRPHRPRLPGLTTPAWPAARPAGRTHRHPHPGWGESHPPPAASVPRETRTESVPPV